MKVLVTGAAGFIGSHIVDLLLDAGHEVLCVDDLSSGRRTNLSAKAMLMVFSIVEKNTLSGLAMQFKPDVICHQAAQASLRRSLDDAPADATINILGTLNVIEAARKVGAHIVFASTSAVYDPDGPLPYAESDPIYPNLPYGIAKASAEMYLRWYGKATILRYGNVYGPRQTPVGENQLVPHVLNYIRHDIPFMINGNGTHTRDLIYVEDVALANLSAMEKKPAGTYNIGTGVRTSVNRVCKIIKDLTGWQGEFVHGPDKPGEMQHSVLNSNRAGMRLSWQARVELAEGLRRTVEAYQ